MRYQILLALIAVVMLIGVVSADTAIIYTANATDGTVYRSVTNATFTNLHNGAGTTLDTTVVDAGVRSISNQNRMYRGVIVFPTDILSDAALVTSSTVGLYVFAVNYAIGDDGVSIFSYIYDNNINIDDYIYTNFGTTNYSAYKNLTTLTTAGYKNWTLNSFGLSNISLIGDTTFSVRIRADAENDALALPFVNGSSLISRMDSHGAESVLYPPFLEVTYTVPPVAAFASNVTGGVDPTAVQFNDTSTNTPTSWSWARKNLTATTWTQFSTVRNATQTFVTGNWSVNLTATNAAGSGISASAWINVSSGVPAPTPTLYPIIFPWCGIQNMFFWNESSDIPGYYVMNHIPQIAKANVTGVLIKAADGSKHFMTFITPAGMPNVSQIAPGMFKFQTYHNVSSAAGVSTVEFQTWNRSSDGTETNLFYGQAISKDLDETSTVMMEYLTPYARRNYTTLFPGDRLMIKLNVSTTSVPEKLIEIGLAGNALASRVEVGWFMCEDPLVALNAHVSPAAGPWVPVINPPTDLIDSDWWKWLSGYWWIAVGGILAILWLGRK